MIRDAVKKDLMDILEIYNNAILNTTAVYDYKVHTLDDKTQWHEKIGFKFSGVIKKAGFKFGKWLDLAFYQLDLKGPEVPSEG